MTNSHHSNSQLPGRAPLRRLGRWCGRVLVGSWALGLGISGMSGCAKARAETSPDGPPLAMPAPPPRVISPAEEPLAAAPVEMTEPAPTPPNPSRRPPARTGTAPAQKPEQAPPAEPPLPSLSPPPVPVTRDARRHARAFPNHHPPI